MISIFGVWIAAGQIAFLTPALDGRACRVDFSGDSGKGIIIKETCDVVANEINKKILLLDQGVW